MRTKAIGAGLATSLAALVREHREMHVEGQLAALELEPGVTEEVVVTFDERGEFIFGCHESGHYDGGMLGAVTVG